MKRQIPLESRKPFLWIHHLVWDDKRLSASAKVVYFALARFANFETQECFPSMETLARECHLKENTIRSALKRLKKSRYIEIKEDKGVVNRYRLLEPTPSKWNSKDSDNKAIIPPTPSSFEPPQNLNPLKIAPATPSKEHHEQDTINNILSNDVASPPPVIGNRLFVRVESFYKETYKQRWGIQPQITYAAWRAMAKPWFEKFLKQGKTEEQVFEKVKALIEFYVQDCTTSDGRMKAELYPDLKVVFSNDTINKFNQFLKM